MSPNDLSCKRIGSLPDSASIWSGFYRKSLKERQALVRLIYPNIDHSPCRSALNPEIADTMIENCIGTLGLPLGLCLNMKIDGKAHTVPMAVEEPSVIAAASGACKTICGNSLCGFITEHSEKNVMIAQIHVLDVDPDVAEKTILSAKSRIIFHSNKFCQSMVKRGGGVFDIEVRKPRTRLRNGKETTEHNRVVVHLMVDVCEAMGANCVSTIAEGVTPLIENLIGGRVSCRILSNLAVKRIGSSMFKIKCSDLNYKGMKGKELAKRIVELFEWADSDEYRAATHNKGIMNGIDSVAMATGQDWRAIEACAHSYITHKLGYYGSLTEYWVEKDEDGVDYFFGKIESPIPVGVKGGPLASNPIYGMSLGLLNNPTSKELSVIMLSVGLAQNFAALRALATEGIQRGHMNLHSRNIATAAGSPATFVSEVAAYMVARGSINIDSAREYLEAHDLLSKLNRLSKVPQIKQPPSMFSYVDDLDPKCSLNAAFSTLGPEPVFIQFGEEFSEDMCNLHDKLFGSGKDKEWLSSIFKGMECFRLHNKGPPRTTYPLQMRLKTLVGIINLLTTRLYYFYPRQTKMFVNRILEDTLDAAEGITPSSMEKNSTPGSFFNITHDDRALSVGLPLLLSLWRVFEFQVRQWVSDPLRTALLNELNLILLCLTELDDSTVEIEERVVKSVNSMDSSGSESTSPINGDSSAKPRLQQKHSTDYIQKIVDDFDSDIHINCNKTKFNNEKDKKDINKLCHFMKGHRKKFVVTLFILCDALSIDSTRIGMSSIYFMSRVGSYFEWITSAIHDICRYERDIEENLPNCYRKWLELRLVEEPNEQTAKEFYQLIVELQKSEKDDLMNNSLHWNNPQWSQLMDTEQVFTEGLSAILKWYQNPSFAQNADDI